jgi:hypothetical protein
MSSTKSSATHQKARLPTTLASLNNGHNSDLRGCYVGVRSSSRPNLVPSRPNLVPARPLRPHSAAWRSSLVANLSSTVPGRAPTAEAKARAIIVVATWRQWPWCTTSFGPTTALCWATTPTHFRSCPLWPQSPWGAGWACAPPIWAHRPRSPQPNWPLSTCS